jgi:hypothetical protein
MGSRSVLDGFVLKIITPAPPSFMIPMMFWWGTLEKKRAV